VISRSSAFAFKGKDVEIPEIARRLNVAHILEGSVRKSGSKIRITAQLIEARSDTHLWSETYDRTLDDIFAIQDEISAAIVGELVNRLGVEVPGTEMDSEVTETSSRAYDTFLLAQHNMNKKTDEGYDRAKLLYQQAISEDPEYAPPYAQLGILWLLNSLGYGTERIESEVALKEAGPLIDRALELDPRNATAYAARGLWLRQNGQVSDSIPVLLEGLKYNPSNSYARNWLSMAYRILMRTKDELDTLREGHRRDPLYPSSASIPGRVSMLISQTTSNCGSVIPWHVMSILKTHPRFGPLIEASEASNRAQLTELFTGACAVEFPAWTPLDSSCAKYAPPDPTN
jgi:tetratricopeptide (TPR) repeat protein